MPTFRKTCWQFAWWNSFVFSFLRLLLGNVDQEMYGKASNKQRRQALIRLREGI